jgi:hypothetical protein
VPLEDAQQLFEDLRRSGEALGRIAEDEATFRGALDAFRAEDGESFQRLLGQVGLGVDCERICRWFCAKECVLLRMELAGPWPEQPVTLEELPRFAEILVKITADEELVERLADAVQDRDQAAFAGLLEVVGAERFAHLVCEWACQVRCRLRCLVVCSPSRVERRNFVAELGIAGIAVRGLLENRETLAELIKSAVAIDCRRVSELVGARGDCEWICLWICSWRCVLVCRRLCGELPREIESPIEEMRAFAQALGRVAKIDGALRRVTEAVLAEDEAAFSSLVKELELSRFCHQLCHWVCYEICQRFCFCVCRPPATIPLFTHVGNYRVDPIWNDFTADGTTTAGGYAFTGSIPLIGILPDGTTPDAEEYRFRTEKYPLGGGPVDVTGSMIVATVIGQLEYWDWNGTSYTLRSANYYVNNPGATVTVNTGPGTSTPVSVNKDVQVGGWIAVPRDNDLTFGGLGRFIPTGGLAVLDTTKLTNEIFDLTVTVAPLPLNAGDSVPVAQRSEKPHFKIYFEARKVLGATPVSSNERVKIALSNTRYIYTRHIEWAGGVVTTIPVLSVDIVEEASGGGCVPLKTDVHVLFSAYHPYLGSCDVRLEGPGIPPPAPVNPAISVDGEAISPVGGHDFNIAALTPCAYIVWLEATLNLTSGYGAVFGTFSDHMAFCKG